MRVGILSFYYPPDLSAGSFRVGALVAALRELAPAGTELDVITTAPNRYHSFAREVPGLEHGEGLRVRRVTLPPHRSDIRGQARAFVTFARAARAELTSRRFDLVFATSSRLMTAALGSWAARHHRAPLYLDIRDIFADTMNDLLPAPLALAARLPLRLIEDWTIRRAQRVNLVSRGFEGYFRARYPRTAFAWFTNGVDDEFIAAAPREVMPLPAGRLPMVLYAGNMGDGQGLHTVLPQLALGLRGRAQFKVIGDGGRRHALVAALEALRPGNVTLQSPVSRAQLLEEYRKADVLFVHLGAHAAFEKVLPSKLFEYASLGKPVLAGVRGFAARFVREEISNAAVFAPGDAAAGVVAFESLTLETRPRPEFIARHSRAAIAHAMAADILSLLPGR